MILLTVLSYNGAPADSLSASFDELGGSIGRADNNQLVLPDPERSISRVHARVVFRGGSYAIVDNGSNPISVNGVPLGAGREQGLRPGDQVQIGGYLLKVSEGASAKAPSDPFADLFGSAAQGLAAPSAPPTPARSVISSWASPPPPAAAPALAPGHIPSDWNPFALDHEPVTTPMARALPDIRGADPLAGLGPGPGAVDSLDDLFGLGALPAGSDPLGAAPQQALLIQPNTAAHADPFASLGRAAPIAPASVADHAPELNSPMLLAPVSTPPPAAIPSGAVFSWDTPAPAQATAAPAVFAPAPVPAPAPLPPAAAPRATPVAAPAAMPAAGEDALLAALLDGLGAPGLRVEALSPALMHLIGQLLRESTRGAVELLLARAALKREMRAEMTMIVGRENNPLKFSPTVEVALQHLLTPPMPGFMAPAPAMRDAFNDLRAHQLGVMAGMRAALDGVLQRFDPQQLEGKLSARSGLASLIPSSRKARLWESFQELFSQLSTEAQDDFDELFGQAFLRAYEAQMDRLHDETPGRG